MDRNRRVEIAAKIIQRNMLAVMGREGDTKTAWDPSKPDEVASVRAMFDSLRSKGYAIYRVTDDGQRGVLMHTFDPAAGKLVAVPRIVGG